MDCNQAEFAMMEHLEKTIHPAQARDLAQHVLNCESCREYYIGLDMALEVLDDAELSAPAADFTQAVMAQVRELPAHTAPVPASSVSVALRVLWGLSAIFVGVGLMFAFNPDWLQALTAASPAVDAVLGAIGTAWQFITGMVEGLSPTYQAGNLNGLSMFNVALIFVVIMGALLLVLQRSEKSHNS